MWDDAFTEYDFGRFHPMAPVRLTLTRDLARASGLLDRPGVEVIGTDDATEEQLTAVHDAPYIEAVRRASGPDVPARSEEHTSELQSRGHLLCRLLLEKINI